MSAISSAVLRQSPTAVGTALMRGLRSGGRAFVREVTGSLGPGARPAPTPRLRLTRRGRLLLLGLPVLVSALAVAAAVVVLLSPSQVSAGTSPLEGPGVQTVTVQPGESLWELAREWDPHRDTRDVVAQIVQLNGLDSARITPGQEVLVPAA